ncbi:MAG: ATP-binding protein [Deltaproteobacteria bacterium]|jgi:AAA15 family ATPase/GTPase|nr:ATP-binding protein [Deltaproteobacteria bacterium]
MLELADGQIISILGAGSNYEKLLVTRQGNKLNFEMLDPVYQTSDGTEVKFDINQESDGTKQVLNLIPFFAEMSSGSSKKVIVIDEIDRSLHTLLTRLLIEEFLDGSSDESRAQLLFTTHDLFLMDKNLFRLDEMWLTERDSDGATALFSISEFPEAKGDKNILKSYITGRMGGIPKVSGRISS